MDERVLLLGGTAEATWLARELSQWRGVRVVTSLAGRVRAPALLPGEVRIGGFGGLPGLTGWLRAHPVRAMIDATHPFAATITATAAAASTLLGLPFAVLRRPGWQPGPGDDWHWVDSLDEAATRLPGLGSRALLTTGRGGLAAFAAVPGVRLLARTLEPPDPPPAWCEVIVDRGPFTVPGELALLARHRIDVLVTKDSGGELTAAKLAAARHLGLPVLLVRRPPVPVRSAPVLPTGAETLHWLRTVLDGPVPDGPVPDGPVPGGPGLDGPVPGGPQG